MDSVLRNNVGNHSNLAGSLNATDVAPIAYILKYNDKQMRLVGDLHNEGFASITDPNITLTPVNTL